MSPSGRGFEWLYAPGSGLRLFTDISLGDNCASISHLKYADDTLLIGEASTDNLWAIKSVLCGFQVALRLRVNFSKSRLLGINVLEGQ